MPTKQIPKVMPGLPKEQKSILTDAMQQAPYLMVGLVLNSRKTGVPLHSSRFYFVASPEAKLVADVTQINEDFDQNLPIGARKDAIVVCYAPLPVTMWKRPPSPEILVERVCEEVKGLMPEVMRAGVRETFHQFYPEGILSPRPGDVSRIAQVPEQLSPNVRAINSTMSGLVSSAALAFDAAIRAHETENPVDRTGNGQPPGLARPCGRARRSS